MTNCVLVLLLYTVSPTSIENQSQKIYFELHASKFVICNDEKKNYGHFFMNGIQLSKGNRATAGRQFTFYQ